MASMSAARPRRRGPAPMLLCLATLCLATAWPPPAHAWLRRADRADVPSVTAITATPLPVAGEAPPDRVFGLLSTPPGWATGDAAVVTLGGRFPATAAQYRLVEALLADGAAVLELDLDAARGASPDSGIAPAPATAADVQAEIFGALAALRAQEKPGPVVVIGLEAAAPAALLAAMPAEAARRLPPGMPGFAAAATLGPGEAGFFPGIPMGAAEGWSRRVPLFCEAMAWGLAADNAAAALAARCIAGLRAPAPALHVMLRPD